MPKDDTAADDASDMEDAADGEETVAVDVHTYLEPNLPSKKGGVYDEMLPDLKDDTDGAYDVRLSGVTVANINLGSELDEEYEIDESDFELALGNEDGTTEALEQRPASRPPSIASIVEEESVERGFDTASDPRDEAGDWVSTASEKLEPVFEEPKTTTTVQEATDPLPSEKLSPVAEERKVETMVHEMTESSSSEPLTSQGKDDTPEGPVESDLGSVAEATRSAVDDVTATDHLNSESEKFQDETEFGFGEVDS